MGVFVNDGVGLGKTVMVLVVEAEQPSPMFCEDKDIVYVPGVSYVTIVLEALEVPGAAPGKLQLHESAPTVELSETVTGTPAHTDAGALIPAWKLETTIDRVNVSLHPDEFVAISVTV